MPHHRIHLPDLALLISAAEIPHALAVEGDEAHHAVAVKRLAVGQSVEVLDGRGMVATGTVEAVSKRSLTVRVSQVADHPRPQRRIVVAAACPKGPRAEAIVEGLSQAGADAFIPLETRRSVAVPSASKVSRWREGTAVESMKQCGRPWLLEVAEVTSFENAVRSAVERRARILLADAAGEPAGPAAEPGETVILIGPEGGFDEEEVQWACSAGATRLRLGPHVLRTETAAVIAAAMVRWIGPEEGFIR